MGMLIIYCYARGTSSADFEFGLGATNVTKGITFLCCCCCRSGGEGEGTETSGYRLERDRVESVPPTSLCRRRRCRWRHGRGGGNGNHQCHCALLFRMGCDHDGRRFDSITGDEGSCPRPIVPLDNVGLSSGRRRRF